MEEDKKAKKAWAARRKAVTDEMHALLDVWPLTPACPAGEGGCADSGAGRHRCRHASFPPHEEEEEEEEEEKDDAASLIPLDVFLRPLVSGSHLFYLILA